MNVLVATPMRMSTRTAFQERSQEIFDSLTHPDKERAVLVNNIPRRRGDPRYRPNAKARNMLIDLHLRDRHTHVLWIDSDLVTVPADIIEQLAEVSTEDIVAPLVYMETLDPDRSPSDCNGGWFYDIGGFIQNGEWTDKWNPTFEGEGNVIELDSVGSCYLIPASVYRQGIRYSAEGKYVEHQFLMEEARAAGYRVYARRDVIVEHAFLPKYGEGWNERFLR